MNVTILGKRLFLGRTPDGDRVYVDVRIQHGADRQTVEHVEIGPCDSLSVMGEVYEGKSGFGDRQCVTAGQCLQTAQSVLAVGGRLARGASEADVRLILESWERWHLNDMRAGCAHVKPVGENSRERLDMTPACPVSGYRWGSAWLIEPLPGDLIQRLGDACERLSH